MTSTSRTTSGATVPGERAGARVKLSLVSMPFVSCRRPSIQLGLLGALCREAGHPTTTHHLGVELAASIGPQVYELLCDSRTEGLGDWLFSPAAFGADAPDHRGELLGRVAPGTVQQLEELGWPPSRLLELRVQGIPEWLDEVAAEVLACEPEVVGFSCTFEQTVASIALALRLKQRDTTLVTVFGGANFDDPMGQELVRAFPAVDVAVAGEADRSLPQLLDALDQQAPLAEVPGVRLGDVDAHPSACAPLSSLNDLPVPDYEEYFDRVERTGLLSVGARREVDLPYESARGCWWGERMHCTFCGLNGTTMTFRSKSPEKVISDLVELTARYRSFRVEAVDNILDRRYLDEVFPEVERRGWSYSMFYEIKADVTPDDLRQLKRAGVDRIQPGIESLSSDVLKLMRKGTRAAQNVTVLRTARENDINVSWNLLWGFPGETARSYEEQAELVPSLVHLQPPQGWGRIWLERYSPLFAEPTTLVSRRPQRSYSYAYPDGVDLDRIAYFFEHTVAGELEDSAYGPLVETLDEWQKRWRGDARPELRMWVSGRLVQIDDTRDPRRTGTFSLTSPLSDVLLALADVPAIPARIARRLDIAERRVNGLVDDLVRARLVMRDGPLVVALPTRAVP